MIMEIENSILADLYFVGVAKHGQLIYLTGGPFIDEDTAQAHIDTLDPLSASCGYIVCKTVSPLRIGPAD